MLAALLLHYLVGTWNCTYRAGTTVFPYVARFVNDRDGRTLRETTSWTGGGDQELFGYDAQHGGWGAVVFEDQGTATVLRGTGSDPNHIAFRSVYPDASLAETIDRISATEYTIHATMRTGGKATHSVDTCLRAR